MFGSMDHPNPFGIHPVLLGEGQSEIDKAVIALARIAENVPVTEDLKRTATMFLKQKEEQDRINYIRSLVEKVNDLEMVEQSLLAALHLAIDTIRTWHGMGVSKEDEEKLWELYQDSPEMRKINEAVRRGE